MFKRYSRRHTPRGGLAPAAGRAVPAALALWLVALAVGPAAQVEYPIFTQDDFFKTMKTVGQNFETIDASLAANDFEAAKARAIRSREQLAITITFWRDRKKDDAIKMLRATTAKFDELDTVLSKEPVDREAARATTKQVEAACQACHAVYRDQDPVTKAYRLKPGSVK